MLTSTVCLYKAGCTACLYKSGSRVSKGNYTFTDALEAVPADDWGRTWPADRTIMLRMTSKKVNEILKKIRPPAFIKFNNNKWFNLNINEEERINTIADWCHITSLELHRGVFSINLAKAMTETFLQHKLKLTRIDMSLNNIGYDKDVLKGLGKALSCCESLVYLDLSQNFIRTAGFYYLVGELSKCPSLSHLDLSWNMIFNERTTAVNVDQKLVLANWLSLTHLDLSFNKISNNNGNNLANVLKQCPNLIHLNLSYNKIRDDGVTSVAEAFGQCSKLTHLDLRNNNISDVGAVRLAEALGQCSNLTYLNISINHIGAAGIESLTRLGIQSLIFDSNLEF